MSKNKDKGKPSFLLNGISHKKAVKEFFETDLENIGIDNSKYNIIKNNTKIDNDDIKEIKFNSSHSITLINTNKVNIENNDNNTECDSCGKEIVGNSVGMPISDSYNPITGIRTFNEMYNHCDFECEITHVLEILRSGKKNSKIDFSNIYKLSMQKFEMFYPGEELRERNKNLHKNKGGVLNDVNYKKISHKFVELPNIRINIASRQFIEN